MSDTAADDDDVRTATERVAEALTEQLQLSGERDRLKEQLLEQLHTLGWTANLFREAAVTTSAHQSKSEQSGSGSKEPSALTVQHLSELLAKKGHETIPDEVRMPMLKQLAQLVREFIKAEECLPANGTPDT